MHIKKVNLGQIKLNLHSGINIIYNNHPYDFQSIATILSETCKMKYGSYIPIYSDYIQYEAINQNNISCVFVDEKQVFDFNILYRSDSFLRREMKTQQTFKKFLDKIDLNAFIFIHR